MKNYPRFYVFGVMVLSSLLLFMSLWKLYPGTQIERQKSVKLPTNFVNSFLQKRNYFFGHAEVADILTGLGLIAKLVRLSDVSDAQAYKALENEIATLQSFAQYKIGMSELYLIAALQFLFTYQKPLQSLHIAKLGMEMPNSDLRLLLLSAFIDHIFLKNLQEAGDIYLKLGQRQGVPDWVSELGNKLKSGLDPLSESDELREKMNKMLHNYFPHIQNKIGNISDDFVWR